MSNGIVTGLAHIGIYVRDMDASVDFYKRLGFSLDREVEGNVRLAFLSAGTCLLELVGRNVEPYREAGIVDHIALAVDDLDAAVAGCKQAGIEVDDSKAGGSSALGSRNLFFTGPDGERLELYQASK